MRQHEERLLVIKLLLRWQLILALLAGAVGAFWSGDAGVGALAGGVTAWLPNCYFAFRAFRYKGARDARRIVRSFYSGMAGKMILTASLFAIMFASLEPLNALAVFAGFIVVQLTSWIVPLVVSRGKGTKHEVSKP